MRRGAIAAFSLLAAGVLWLLSQYEVRASDVQPYLTAGEKVLDREGDVYADPLFIYPPTMALVFAPLTYLGETPLFVLLGYSELLAVGLAGCLTARLLGWRRWVEIGCLAAAAAVLARTTRDSFAALNVHAYLLPAFVTVCGLWSRQRWEAGAYLLAATALVKPILAPLLVIPLLRGQWRALLRPGLAACGFVAAAAALVPGGWNVIHLPAYVLDGIGMHGNLSLWNLSISAMAREYDLSGPAVLVLRTLIALGMVGAMARYRQDDPTGLLLLATVLLLGSFLAGSVSELSYTLLLMPGLMAALSRARGLALVLLGSAVMLMVLPHAALGGTTSTLHAGLFAVFVAELLCFAGLLATRVAHDEVRSSRA